MKKKITKFIATLTVCAVSLSGFNIYAAGDNPGTIKGTYTFGAHNSDRDLTDTYSYSDKFFEKSGYEENFNLAIMSMQVAAASISSSEADYQDKSVNIQDLLKQLGFNNIEVNEYYKQKMDFNTMGAAVAYKSVGDSVILVLVPRSAGYENEWAGNFVVGNEGKYHKGFDTTSNIVLNFAKEYVSRHADAFKNKNVKVWTMGYSRGAATANLIGAKLIDNPEYLGVKVTADNIYDYTFGTPETVVSDDAKDTKYNCIYNYMTDYDIVSMVPFKAWNFTRYGVEKFLDVHSDSVKEKFLANLIKLNKNVYDIYTADNSIENPDRFEAKTLGENLTIIKDVNTTISQKEFLEERIDFVTKNYAPDRATYNEKYEEAISTMAGLYLGADEDALSAFSNGVADSADKYKAVITMFFSDYIENYCNKMGLDNKLPVVIDKSILPDPDVETGNEAVDEFLKSDDYKSFYEMVTNVLKNGYLDGTKTYRDVLSEYKTFEKESVKNVLVAGFDAMKAAGYEEEYNKYSAIIQDDNAGALTEIIEGFAFGINYTDDMTITDILIKKINQVCTLAGNNAYMRVHNNEVILSWLKAMKKAQKTESETETNKDETTVNKEIDSTKAPQTGDNNDMLIYACIIALTIITTAGMVSKKSKEQL